MILQDRRVKVSVIAHELGISADTGSSIIHSVLMMSKVRSRWVPRMLSPKQKACRQQFSEDNLDIHRVNPENSSQEVLQEMKRGSISMIQRPHKSSCKGSTRGPRLWRNVVCNNQPERSWRQFIGLRGCSIFAIHATQDYHYWRYLCFHNSSFTREYQTETPWKVVGCFMTMHPQRSHAHRMGSFSNHPSLHLRHNSFPNPSVALPTSQLILQPFRCFTYVTALSPTLLSLLLRHLLFSYVTWLAAHAVYVTENSLKPGVCFVETDVSYYFLLK